MGSVQVVPCSAICAGFIWGGCIRSSDKLRVRQHKEKVPPKGRAGLLATHWGKKPWFSQRRHLSLNISSSASRQLSRDLSRWWLVLTSPLRAISHLWLSPVSQQDLLYHSGVEEGWWKRAPKTAIRYINNSWLSTSSHCLFHTVAALPSFLV